MDTRSKKAVLFIIFNRPEIAAKTFAKICAYRPERLYIAADGARKECVGEENLCQKTRANVINAINWPCEVKTLFHDKNLGCGRGPYTAISWFFEHEEEGIILEDDCCPCPEFFPFCEEMLELYRDNEHIAQINTFNAKSPKLGNSYFFTGYPRCWGWATWARAWQHMDFEMKTWKQERRNIFRRFNPWEGLIHYWHWNQNYRIIKNGGKPSIWDYQWGIYIFLQNKLCITPEVNLIENIGFSEGTHCSGGDKKLERLCYGQLQFPLKHPQKICIDPLHEAAYSKDLCRSFFLRRFYEVKNFVFRRN